MHLMATWAKCQHPYQLIRHVEGMEMKKQHCSCIAVLREKVLRMKKKCLPNLMLSWVMLGVAGA